MCSGAELGDRLLELADELVDVRAQGRSREVDEAGWQRIESLLQRREAGRSERGRADAVVRRLAREDQVAVGLSGRVPGEPDELQRGLDSLRAAVGEEDVVEPGRRKLREPGGEPDRRLVGEVPERGIELELRHLLGGDAPELLPAMADGALPEAARAIDVLLAVDVPEQCSLAARPDDRRRRTAHDGMGMDDVRGVELGERAHTGTLPGGLHPRRFERREDSCRELGRATVLHERNQVLEDVSLVAGDARGEGPWEPALLELELPPVHHGQSTSLPRSHLARP